MRQRRTLHTNKRDNTSKGKTIIYLYVPKVSASNFIKHTLKDTYTLKAHIDSSTVQERSGNTLKAIGIGKDFLNRTLAAQQLRERIEKWDYMK
jgi:hypothetical protein